MYIKICQLPICPLCCLSSFPFLCSGISEASAQPSGSSVSLLETPGPLPPAGQSGPSRASVTGTLGPLPPAGQSGPSGAFVSRLSEPLGPLPPDGQSGASGASVSRVSGTSGPLLPAGQCGSSGSLPPTEQFGSLHQSGAFGSGQLGSFSQCGGIIMIVVNI